MASAMTFPPGVTDQTGLLGMNLAGKKSMEAAGANNIMAQFDTIAEADPPELFGKQLGIQRTRPSSTWSYHWSTDKWAMQGIQ